MITVVVVEAAAFVMRKKGEEAVAKAADVDDPLQAFVLAVVVVELAEEVVTVLVFVTAKTVTLFVDAVVVALVVDLVEIDWSFAWVLVY